MIDRHPNVARRMREALDAWWQGVEPVANQAQRIIIGSDEENPMMLSACEWKDVFVDQQRQARIGDNRPSPPPNTVAIILRPRAREQRIWHPPIRRKSGLSRSRSPLCRSKSRLRRFWTRVVRRLTRRWPQKVANSKCWMFSGGQQSNVQYRVA